MSMSFVIASKSDQESEGKVKQAMASIRGVRGGNDQIIVIRDAPSMAHAYNKAVARAQHERICFIHNDVELRRSEYWQDEVLDAIYEKFPIGFIGAAGSKDVFPDGRWYVEGNRVSGLVLHGQFYAKGQQPPPNIKPMPVGDGRSYAEWPTIYGDFGRVVALDGVVLVTTKAALEEIGGFDEEAFSDAWHYYDLDATLRAHLAGLHNVTIPLLVRHLSLGSYNDHWALTKDRFMKKWKEKLPVALEHGDDYTIEAVKNIQLG